MSSANETSRVLLHAFAAAVRPLLSDLGDESVADWELIFPEESNEPDSN